MAQGTTSHPGDTPRQSATPGVGATPGSAPAGMMRPSMQGVAQTPTTEGAPPVLYEDIDPVLLARLYPQAMAGGIGDARNLAMEAGNAAHDAAMDLVANAQEDVPPPTTGTSAEPTREASSTRPQVAPARPGEPAMQDPAHSTTAGVAYPPQQHAESHEQNPQRHPQQHHDDKDKHDRDNKDKDADKKPHREA